MVMGVHHNTIVESDIMHVYIVEKPLATFLFPELERVIKSSNHINCQVSLSQYGSTPQLGIMYNCVDKQKIVMMQHSPKGDYQ